MCVCVCVFVFVRAYRAGHTKDIRNPYPPILHFFCAQKKKKKKLGNKEKIEEFESKNYLKADQSQNVTVLVITCSRYLEFKNFPYQATMVAANTFRCS